ncbi:MAG TPA: hypothetical protein VNH46_12320, partial [Gemmatimonadales bacterium]|nr:hypothetical protein [Gemmatimonadales bacterium]
MLTRADVLAIGLRIEATFPPGLTDPHRGYTSFGAGTRLFAKLRRLDTDAEFAHLIRSFERIGLAPDVDQSLILAIAFRESGPLVLGSRTRLVDTFHQGGLDRLYREAPRLEHQGFLPRRVRRALRPGSTSATEGTTPRRTRRAAAALIPQRDLIVAYGAVIRDRYHRFVHRAAAAGLSTDDLDTRARRIWT